MRAVKSVHASRNMGDTLFPSILPVLRQFWRIEGMFKAADGSLLRSGYVEMNLKLQLVFNPKPTEKEALAAAAWDWANDSLGELSISFQTFANSVMEMLQLYGTHNPAQLQSEEYHCELLRTVLERISFCPSPEELMLKIVRVRSSLKEKERFRAALETAFDQIDTDNSGTLDLEELRAMPGFQQEMLDKLDTDGDGELSRAEFIDAQMADINQGLPAAETEGATAEDAEDNLSPQNPRRLYRDDYDILSLDGIRRPRPEPLSIPKPVVQPRRKSFMERMDGDTKRRHDHEGVTNAREKLSSSQGAPARASFMTQGKHTLQPLDGTPSPVPLPFVANVAKKRVVPRRRSLDLSAHKVGSSLPSHSFATVPGPSNNRPGSRLGARPLVPSIAHSQAGLSPAANIATASTQLSWGNNVDTTQEQRRLPVQSRSMDFGKRRYARRASLPMMATQSSIGTAQWAGVVKLDSGPPRNQLGILLKVVFAANRHWEQKPQRDNQSALISWKQNSDLFHHNSQPGGNCDSEYWGAILENASINLDHESSRVPAVPGGSALMRNQEIDAFPTNICCAKPLPTQDGREVWRRDIAFSPSDSSANQGCPALPVTRAKRSPPPPPPRLCQKQQPVADLQQPSSHGYEDSVRLRPKSVDPVLIK